MGARLRVYSTPDAPAYAEAPEPTVRVSLGDLLPLVALAQRNNYQWLRDFLDDEGVSNVVEAGSALGFWKRHAGQTQFRRLAEKFARITSGFVQLFRERPHFAFREFPHTLSQQLLFFGELQVHDQSPRGFEPPVEDSILTSGRVPCHTSRAR